MEEKRNEEVEYSIFVDEMTTDGYDKQRVEDIIDKMHENGDIYYPVKRYIKIL